MRSLTDFAPQVILSVGDVPIEIVEEYVREAAIDFCQHAHPLARVYDIPLRFGQTEYVIPVSGHERITALDWVELNGRRVPFVGPPTLCGCGPYTVTFDLPNHLQLRPGPRTEYPGTMRVLAVTTPTRDACEVDDALYERYHDAVVHGAIAKLLAIPSQPWYNANAAKEYALKYEVAARTAGTERVLGNRLGPFVIRAPRIV